MTKTPLMSDAYPSALSRLIWGLVWLALVVSYCVGVELAHAEEPTNLEQIVSAIYVAEGGAHTRHPFGILSVPCSGYTACRRICRNTVRNTYRRWIKAGQPGDYLAYLQHRYCPVGARNDPTGLNGNWLWNVRKNLEKMQ